jgi:hypothetical protein
LARRRASYRRLREARAIDRIRHQVWCLLSHSIIETKGWRACHQSGSKHALSSSDSYQRHLPCRGRPSHSSGNGRLGFHLPERLRNKNSRFRRSRLRFRAGVRPQRRSGRSATQARGSSPSLPSFGGVIEPRIHLSQAAILFRKTGPPLGPGARNNDGIVHSGRNGFNSARRPDLGTVGRCIAIASTSTD